MNGEQHKAYRFMLCEYWAEHRNLVRRVHGQAAFEMRGRHEKTLKHGLNALEDKLNAECQEKGITRGDRLHYTRVAYERGVAVFGRPESTIAKMLFEREARRLRTVVSAQMMGPQ